MSEHVTPVQPPSEAHHVEVVPAEPFNERQIKQFDADDGDAGRAIGKMLASFFLYTVIVMSLVAWWTVNHSGSGADAHKVHEAHPANGEEAGE